MTETHTALDGGHVPDLAPGSTPANALATTGPG
jgi:hypothetical protein